MRPFKTPHSPSYHNSFHSGWLDFSNARKHTDRVQGFIHNWLKWCRSDQRQSCTHAAAWRTCWRHTASLSRLQECQLCPHAHVATVNPDSRAGRRFSGFMRNILRLMCGLIITLKQILHFYFETTSSTQAILQKQTFILFKNKDYDLFVLLYHD